MAVRGVDNPGEARWDGKARSSPTGGQGKGLLQSPHARFGTREYPTGSTGSNALRNVTKQLTTTLKRGDGRLTPADCAGGTGRNAWTPVGESEDEQGREHPLVEIRTAT
jgi:hypothetical protein